MKESYTVTYWAKDGITDPKGFTKRKPVEVTKDELIELLQSANVVVSEAVRKTVD